MLSSLLLNASDTNSCPIYLMGSEDFVALTPQLSTIAQGYLTATHFKHEAGNIALLPGISGALEAVILCITAGCDPLLTGKLPSALPEGIYHFAEPVLSSSSIETATLAFLMGAYKFTRYNKKAKSNCKLVASKTINSDRIRIIADAIAHGRDLINTPTSDLGPEAFANVAIALAEKYNVKPIVITGDDLLKHNFPMIHAVGRAADEAPRLVEFSWGDTSHPKVTLIGKSVCFDTGGLNIKPDSSMLLMKKDMGGGAITLAIAKMVIELNLKVRLRVILPIVENSISGNAFRPGDILNSRKGLNVEIGNTDAEGRLILADALALASEEMPELLFDFATLTGAARVALGAELPPFYTDDEGLAKEIVNAGNAAHDPVWRMPLWNNYDTMLASKIADVNHISAGGFAGSITAALFLRRFVAKDISWCHFDTYAWSQSSRPAHPEGGEVQVALLMLNLLETRYGTKQK